MTEVDDLVSRLPRYSRNREILERILNSQSVYSQIDDNGRLVLSARLRELVDIKNQAVLVGMGDKFQIWEPDAYAADMKDIDDQLSSLDDVSNLFALLDSSTQRSL